MAHRYVWVLTRNDGLGIDDVLAHCGSEDDAGKYCCVCAAGASCEWHPPAMSAEEWDEWLSENAFIPGCANHLMWDYASVGNAYREVPQLLELVLSGKGTIPDAGRRRGADRIRLSNLDVDQAGCVPFQIVNGAVRLEKDISELRIRPTEINYASELHRPQVKDYLATIPNPAQVIVWHVVAHI